MTKKVPNLIFQPIRSTRLAPPVGPFSQAVAVDGFIFLSGQVGQDPLTGKLVQGGVTEEAEQVLCNIASVLEAAGKELRDVVRVGIFLTNIYDFAAVNEVYARYFAEPYPARTTIGVSALPLGASIEMDVIVKD